MRTFPAIPQSVHAARRFATDTLSGSPTSMLEAVELMVSELATNCIRHERASFHITILGSNREIRVEVTDPGSGTPTMRSPGPDEPSGRGLQIVDMLSDSWGVEREQPSGKTVWFTMPAASAAGLVSDHFGAHPRISTELSSFAAGSSAVQCVERAPHDPTSLHRCGGGVRPRRSRRAGRRSGLRWHRGGAHRQRADQRDHPGG